MGDDQKESSLFLVNKKLADLHKALEENCYNKTVLINNIKTFQTRYNNELLNIFNDYYHIMKNINDELQITRKNKETEIRTIYEKRYEHLKTELDAFYHFLQQSLIQQLNQYDISLIETRNKIDEIANTINDEMTKFNQFDYNSIKIQIQKARNKIINDFEEKNSEAFIKYNQLKIANEEKFKKLDVAFQKSVIDLKKKFFMSSKDKSHYFNRHLSQCSHALSEYADMKNSVFELKNDYKTFIDSHKKKAIDMIQTFPNEKEYIDRAQKEYEAELKKIDDFLNDVRRIQSKEKQRLEEQYENAKENWRNELENLQKIYENQKIQIENTLNSLSDPIEEFRNELINELEKVKAQYDLEESPTKKKLLNLEIEIKNFPNFNEEYGFLLQKLNQLKYHHNTEIQNLHNQYEQEKININEQSQSKSEDKKRCIDLIKEKNELEKTLEKHRKEISELMKDYNDYFIKSINEFENEMKLNIIKEKDLYDIDIENFRNQTCHQIETQRDINNRIKFEQQSFFENQRLSYLTSMKHDIEADKEFDNLLINFCKQYNDLENELENIDQTGNLTKALTDHDVENERILLNEREIEISKEKLQIINAYQEKINNENQRHLNKFSFIKEQEEQEELKKTQESEVGNIKNMFFKRYKEKEYKYSYLLDELSNLENMRFEISAQDLDEKIIELQKELNTLNINLNKEKEHQNQITFQGISAIKTQIKNQIENNFQNLQYQKNSLEIEITEKFSKIAFFESQLLKAVTNKKNLISREISNFQLDEQKKKNDYVKNSNDLEQQIADERKFLFTKKPDINTDLLKQKKDQALIEKEIISEHQYKLSRLHKKKDKAIKEYESLLNLAKARCQDAKNLYATKKMRPEEKKIITRLETRLELVSKELNLVTKDMISYRSQLQSQEESYNVRFGTTPKVGVAMVKPRPQSQLTRLFSPH